MPTKKSLLSADFLRKQDEKIASEIEQLKKKKKEIKNFPEFGSSNDDAAQEVTEFSTDNSLIKKIDLAIKDMNEARKAISNGNYGVCKNCSERILKNRLEIIPETVYCSTCKSQKMK